MNKSVRDVGIAGIGGVLTAGILTIASALVPWLRDFFTQQWMMATWFICGSSVIIFLAGSLFGSVWLAPASSKVEVKPKAAVVRFVPDGLQYELMVLLRMLDDQWITANQARQLLEQTKGIIPPVADTKLAFGQLLTAGYVRFYHQGQCYTLSDAGILYAQDQGLAVLSETDRKALYFAAQVS